MLKCCCDWQIGTQKMEKSNYIKFGWEISGRMEKM
jgi:hypothetical protein